ncbi:terminase small subunit [Halomonas sp. DP8Y7-1]|uniref:terminase small subunit n=1 Tax=Halomonas sp. DP8Y7-1 TaxID=2859078 RepID=UPI001C94DEC9|nr:terminase small subunit [Halomonas sp. DP8Y7-1]MBY6029990.1 terminase small subunit [Halomonas sp. DP8Y7-1]
MNSRTARRAVELTPRQSRFRDEYLIDLNATKAALRAGFAKSTAEKKAPLWVGKSRESCPPSMRHVWDAVNEARAERSERTKIDADYVLHRLVEIDQMDVLDILADDGSILPIREWPMAWRRTLSGLDVSELWEHNGDTREQVGLLKKIKWPDKVKNLELLGKHVDVQAWRERQEITGKNGGPIETVGITTDDPQEAARLYRDMMGD